MLKLSKQLLYTFAYIALPALVVAFAVIVMESSLPRVVPDQQLQSVAPQLKPPSKVLSQNQTGGLSIMQDYSFVEVAPDGSTVQGKADLPPIENEVRVYHYGASAMLLFVDQSGKVTRVFVGST